jgi:mannan endo-1,4-beta-mannosidase
VKRLTIVVLVIGIVSIIVACTASGVANKNIAQATITRPPASKPVIGIFEPGVPLSYLPISRFVALTGVQPAIDLYYGGWGDPFRTTFAEQATAHGALPFVQINPDHATMAAVAAGRYDTYIRYYANAVRSFGKPVIIGFAAEPNGDWDQWGWKHTAPSTWISAWRHFVSVFRSVGARDVIWLWTINSTNVTSAPVRQWWPGSGYVTWIGIDGYYYRPSDTFESVFGTTIAEVRKFTDDPILISETAVGPVAGVNKIADLFRGVLDNRLVGLVWFDQAQHEGIYHQDWRLEDNPAMLAAFRRAAKIFGNNSSKMRLNLRSMHFAPKVRRPTTLRGMS